MINSKTDIKTSDLTLRKVMYQVYDGKCFYTGVNLLFDEIHIDHINPVINGGNNCIENYVLCSQYINLKKNGKKDDYFIERVSLINNLLFVDKVVEVYNEYKQNEFINEEYNYSIDLFCKQSNINISGKNKILMNLRKYNKVIAMRYIKTTGKISSKNRLFANKKDLDELKLKFNL